MTNPYEELSPRAKWFMENFDEYGIAEICASHEAAAAKADAAIEQVRALAKSARVATWQACTCDGRPACGCPSRPVAWKLDPADILAALDQPQEQP